MNEPMKDHNEDVSAASDQELENADGGSLGSAIVDVATAAFEIPFGFKRKKAAIDAAKRNALLDNVTKSPIANDPKLRGEPLKELLFPRGQREKRTEEASENLGQAKQEFNDELDNWTK